MPFAVQYSGKDWPTSAIARSMCRVVGITWITRTWLLSSIPQSTVSPSWSCSLRMNGSAGRQNSAAPAASLANSGPMQTRPVDDTVASRPSAASAAMIRCTVDRGSPTRSDSCARLSPCGSPSRARST